jgi:hypothetical protein
MARRDVARPSSVPDAPPKEAIASPPRARSVATSLT